MIESWPRWCRYPLGYEQSMTQDHSAAAIGRCIPVLRCQGEHGRNTGIQRDPVGCPLGTPKMISDDGGRSRC